MTLDSILCQNDTEQGIEIIVTDGMATDGTREIIKTYNLLNNSKDKEQI